MRDIIIMSHGGRPFKKLNWWEVSNFAGMQTAIKVAIKSCLGQERSSREDHRAIHLRTLLLTKLYNFEMRLSSELVKVADTLSIALKRSSSGCERPKWIRL